MTDFPLFIDGEYGDAEDGATYPTVDPSTGEQIGTVAEGSAADAARAVAAARTAFDDGRWSGLPASKRAEVLQQVAAGIKDQAKELAELEMRDAGSTMAKAKAVDVGNSILWFRTMAELAPALDQPEMLPHATFPTPSTNLLRHDPVGVVGAIVPWNFPLQMAAWKISMALAAGNTIVVKPAPETPCTVVRLAAILKEAGVPDGVVNVVPGPGPGTGEELVTNADVDKVSFTGSTEVGKHVMRMAAGTLKKVTLELGGKNAQVVLDDADLDLAVDGVVYGAFFHSGQQCTAGSRVLLPAALHDEFVERVLARIQAITVGPAADRTTTMGPVVSQRQLDTVLGYIGIGTKEGARLVAGGQRLTDGALEHGFFIAPTVFTDVTPEMTIAQEEIFGPVLAVLRYADEDEAVAIANGTPYGLAGAVWGSPARALAIATRLRTGTVWVNEYNLLNPRFPFGGFKQSGIGREHGLLGLLEYTEPKHVHVAIDATRASKRWFDMTVPLKGA